MKEKTSTVKNKDVNKKTTRSKKSDTSEMNGCMQENRFFNEENLPPHHYDTVIEWLLKLTTETAIFAQIFEKKIIQASQERIFKKSDFRVSDINSVLHQLYKIYDSSIGGLQEFRKSIGDYISTWETTVNDNPAESSDSSAEVLTAEPKTIKGNDILHSDGSNNDIIEKEQPADNDGITEKEQPSDNKLAFRILKPSELNKLVEEELSVDSSSAVTGSINNDKASICDKPCIILSSDDDEPKQKQKTYLPTKNLRKLSGSKNGNKTVPPTCVTLSSDSEKSSESSIYSLKNKNKKSLGNKSDSDEVAICSDNAIDKVFKNNNTNDKSSTTRHSLDEMDSETSRKLENGKDEVKARSSVKKSHINWDTSTEIESDGEWITTSKTSQKQGKKDEKKKILKSKKQRAANKKEEDKFSSFSDSDELNKLCDFKNLNKRKRSKSSTSSNSSENEEKKLNQKDKETPTKKSKNKDISLLDCMNSGSNSPASSSSEVNMDFDFVKSVNSFPKDDGLKLEEFGKMLSESDGISVISDSSFDSTSELLLKNKVKIKRKTSDKKETEIKKTSRKRRRDKLLDCKLSDTDSSEAEEKYQKRKMKTKIDSTDSEQDDDVPIKPSPKKRQTRNSKKSRHRKSLFSDSDVSLSESDSEKEKGDDDDDDKNNKDSDDEKQKRENKKKRKRIQRHSDSSSDENGEPTPSKSDGKGRRNIRKVLKEESLEKTTKEALKEEEERKRRIAEKQALYNQLISKASESEDQVLDELVLDFDVKTKEPLVSVDKDLVKKLKPHQAQGIKFMWDSCFESVAHAKKDSGSGCILAHCMGLGKTLQVITLVHTLLTSDKVDVNRVLVVAPFSTVQNWVNEFRKWLKDVGSGEDIEIYNMIKTAVNHRSYQLRDWERTGGVLILGYNLFRTLIAPKSRMKLAVKKAIEETLIDPGPDVVICDEGHILKNEKTAIAKAMSKLKTRRRIVLTGTPLQNNLVEYHCMVQFVKPNLLGTRKEFQNRFVHPIQNGQFEDSTAHDVKVMKRRAHVLHKMLDGIVQRKDYNVLTPYLPPKYEYVIHVKLTDIQCKLYRHYLENLARKSKNEGGGLFQDFQHLMRICTHPRSLLIHSDKEQLKKDFMDEDSEGSLKDFIDDGSDSEEKSTASSKSSNSDSERSRSKTPPKRKTRSTRAGSGTDDDQDEVLEQRRTEWWSDMVTDEELQDIKSSAKLFLFFTILKHCEEIGDKLLVFSQSLYTLDLIEHFLQMIDENTHKSEEEQNPLFNDFNSNWDKGVDYFRLDGSASSDNRANWCKVFNQASNTRARLFLISTRAGGLGINLTGANRVIIFDASWNPSFDVQSIFRVYRFGQEKPCYIYRFLSKGTMEEKIYERQVAKLSTSLRVIDEQQIDRHFTQTSLAELYAFNPEVPENRETPILPKDRLMAELLQTYPDLILNHHQHDSLLENQEDEELNEEERKAAWLEFENEKNHVPPPNPFLNQAPGFSGAGYQNAFQNSMNQSFLIQAQTILTGLVNKVRAANPSLNEDVVRTRAVEVLQSMPFWQQGQGMLMNNYIQQQQQQYYQQQYMQQQQQQQQALMAQQQAQMKQMQKNVQLKQKAPTVGKTNGTNSSASDANLLGRASDTIEINDDE